MKKNIPIAVLFSLLCFLTHAQDLIKSGPMVGYSTMREVLLWIQTNQEAEVYFEYYEKNNPKIRFRTQRQKTIRKNGFVGKLIADQVMPGKEYNYDLFIKSNLNYTSHNTNLLV